MQKFSALSQMFNDTAMILGSDFMVGTGVYIDDVQAERMALAQIVKDHSWIFLFNMALLFFGIIVVTLATSYFGSRSIVHYQPNQDDRE